MRLARSAQHKQSGILSLCSCVAAVPLAKLRQAVPCCSTLASTSTSLLTTSFFLSGQDGHRARAHRVFLFSFHSSLLSVGIARYRSGHVLWGRRSWDSGSTTVVLVEGLGGFGSGNFSARVWTGDASLFKVRWRRHDFVPTGSVGGRLCAPVWRTMFSFLCVRCGFCRSSTSNVFVLPATTTDMTPCLRRFIWLSHGLKLLFLTADVSTAVLLWRLLRCGDHSVC